VRSVQKFVFGRFPQVLSLRRLLPNPDPGRDARASGVLCLLRRRPFLPRRPGPSPLPGEGRAGWVDGQRDRRLVPSPIYPSPRDDLPPVGLFFPFLGERLGGGRFAQVERGCPPPPRRLGPESLLQREKDRKRGRKISLDSVLFPFYPSPQDDLPSAGPKSPPWREFVPDPTPQHVNTSTRPTPSSNTSAGRRCGTGGRRRRPSRRCG
jgi:hypothetical protein